MDQGHLDPAHRDGADTTALALALSKLDRLVPRLASDTDGKVVTIGRVLTASGLDWHGVVPVLRPTPERIHWRPEAESWSALAA
jgi:hypothetical protein